MSFVIRFKMLFQQGLLYFNIIYIFSFGKSVAGEILKAEFTASVTGASKIAECSFSLEFTDVELLKTSRVRCDRNKQMTVNSFVYELKSLNHHHVFREALKDCVIFLENLFD